MRITNKWWMNRIAPIRGFEDEGEAGAGEGDGTSGEGAGEGQGTAGTGEGGNSPTDDAAGLKSALQKERADRKALDKELKALRAAKQTADDAEKTEIQRLTDSSTATTAKLEKLAAGFRANALETAVLRAAGALKFRDATDALRTEVFSAIGLEQDEDDPTKVTIDEASVTAAVKALAKNKPHYLGTPDRTSAPKSGSQFGGSSNGQGSEASAKATLAAKYPALRGRI